MLSMMQSATRYSPVLPSSLAMTQAFYIMRLTEDLPIMLVQHWLTQIQSLTRPPALKFLQQLPV